MGLGSFPSGGAPGSVGDGSGGFILPDGNVSLPMRGRVQAAQYVAALPDGLLTAQRRIAFRGSGSVQSLAPEAACPAFAF
jgi:hypothetical protein